LLDCFLCKRPHTSAERRGGVQSDFEQRLARSGAVRVRSGLRGLIELLFRNPVPGEEFVEPGLRSIRDAAEAAGYNRHFSLGLVSGSACLGMLIPLSLLMVV